jgi:ABC-type branched-subunit amino acid transport system permease subunit
VLTISATANAGPGTYRVIVCGTNGDFTANSPIAGVASVTNTFVVTDSNSFSMSVSPASTSVIGGTATNVSATVTLTDNSPVLSGVLTNGVRNLCKSFERIVI